MVKFLRLALVLAAVFAVIGLAGVVYLSHSEPLRLTIPIL